MAIVDDQPGARAWISAITSRLRRVRFVVPAAAAVLLGLALAGELAPLPAWLGAAAVLAAAALDARLAAAGRAALDDDEDGRSDRNDRVLNALIAGMPDPVILIEGSGNVRAFNRPALDIAPALAQAQPLSFALRHPGVIEAVRHAAENGKQRVEVFQRVPAERWWDAVIAPVQIPLDPPGDSDRLLLLEFHDLTPLRQMEQMRADFVANASHELRTPLASLSGFIDTLQGPARSDAAAREKFLGIMKAQAARMARLIDDLLSLSRIELKAHIRPETPIDLVLVLRQVADGLQPLAHERGVVIAFEPPAQPVMVPGDRDELVRSFENLVENALKYGASGKRVDITLAREAAGETEAAVASVRDYGPGIAPEHLPRLTERFYRADVAESRAQGGTGLGLALVKHIVQRHRGRLGIESTPGAGATFSIRLPTVTGRRTVNETV